MVLSNRCLAEQCGAGTPEEKAAAKKAMAEDDARPREWKKWVDQGFDCTMQLERDKRKKLQESHERLQEKCRITQAQLDRSNKELYSNVVINPGEVWVKEWYDQLSFRHANDRAARRIIDEARDLLVELSKMERIDD
jgi:hypothetical protein